MKLNKKLLLIPLVASIGIGGTTLFANYANRNNEEPGSVAELQQESRSLVSTVTGEVKQIETLTNDEGNFYSIFMETHEGTQYYVNILDNTVFIKGDQLISLEDIEEGMEITAHYMGEGIVPLILIFDEDGNEVPAPGSIGASAIVVNDEDSLINVHVDVFDNDLVSSNNDLMLHVDEDTVVLDTNGNSYEGSLENKELAVIYLASSMSIPAIPIMPTIIVIGDVDSPYDVLEESTEQQPISMVDLLPEHARGTQNR